MANQITASADEVLYKHFKYRIASPIVHHLGCMDVLTKERKWHQKLSDKFSTRSIRPLVRRGSMLDKDMMAGTSKWQSEDAEPTRSKIQRGLDDLKNFLIKQPVDEEVFKKKSELEHIVMSWMESKGGSAWLLDIAGIHFEKGRRLSCRIEGLTSVSVDYGTLRGWISAGDWCPNVTTLALESADWSTGQTRKVKSLWIVTEVLYATKLSISGRNGVSSGVKAQVPTQVPGLNAGGNVTIKIESDAELELKAKRNKKFIVGYRTMRVDYNPDGTVRALGAPDDTGLRANDDDPYQTNLKSMEEDIFEVDDDGDTVPIPLLTPTKEELANRESRVINSKDSVGESAST